MRPNEIKAALVHRGITVTSIARELKVSRQLVSHVVHYRLPNARVRCAVADAIGLPYLLVWGSAYPRQSDVPAHDSITQPIADAPPDGGHRG